MSWSIEVKASDPDDIKDQISEKKAAGANIPDQVTEAIVKTACAFGSQSFDRDYHVSSHGHVGEDGQGNASISFSVTKRPVDATSAEGARELADRLKG